jgi:hypothetical protein
MLRRDPSGLASWDVIADLQKKLPDEVADGAEPAKLDAATLSTAIEEAEGVLLSRLSALEAL